MLRRWDTRVLRRRLPMIPAALQRFVVANPGHLPMLRELLGEDVELHLDFSVYHINNWAVDALEEEGVGGRYTLSLEDDKPNMDALLAVCDAKRFEAIAYTDTPLFVAEACSLAALYGGCPGAKVCKHETLKIENEHGDQFLVHHDRCRSTVIGENALAWSGSLDWFRERGVGYFRLDFTTRPYSFADVARIVEAVKADKFLPQTHSENLERVLL